jgi:carotenoid cleavage dioxygenase
MVPAYWALMGPAGLRGTLVRNGPNPLQPDPAAHWFLGDGMLHAFEIGEGRICYRNRWVQTERLARQRQVLAGQLAADQVAQPDDGVANTHIVAHAGRVFALEEAHLPMEIALASLDTRGACDFDGTLPHGPFTAHPKTDPATGEMLFFGYGSPDRLSAGMSFGVLSPQGRVTQFEHFQAPYASMVHDFAITERHVIFPVLPLTGSVARAQAGRPPYAWEPEYGARVGLMPRGGSVQDLVWWEGPACFVFHVMNAWEEDTAAGRTLFMDVMQFERPPLFPLPDGRSTGNALAHLTRWRFELDQPERRFSTERLAPQPGEFPRIDDRVNGRRHTHGWYAVGNVDRDANDPSQASSALAHWVRGQAELDLFELPLGDHLSEPVFVPRSADAPEGDGWVLALIYRGRTDTSDLVVFDAGQVSAGPVCVASLPHRVPDGFHGNWFDRA